MYPILIDFGLFKLHTYGLTMFLAFAIGIIIAAKRGKKRGIADNVILDISTATIISGILGGRILYIITHLEEFRGHWLDMISPIQSDGTIGIAGLVLLGGVILAIATIIFIAWLKSVPILKLLDVLAPSLALGIAIGRIGCFFNGCCFGLPTDLPWGVVFPEGCLAYSVMGETRLHPTQLYAVLYNLFLFVLLLLSEKRFYRFDGFTTFLFFFVYGFFRFLNETLRWQEESMRLIVWKNGFLTISQVVSLGMFVLGIIGFIVTRRYSISHKRSTT